MAIGRLQQDDTLLSHLRANIPAVLTMAEHAGQIEQLYEAVKRET